MKYYLFNELGENRTIRISEKEILDYYFDCWSKKIIQATKNKRTSIFGKNPDQIITDEKCIEDWCTINWAWEQTENDKGPFIEYADFLKNIKDGEQ